MEGKKSLNNLRDCVKEAFNNGSQVGWERKKMAYAIIVELRRISFNYSEIKDKLLEWNERCERPYNFSEQRIKLLKYVDWVEKKGEECRLGCRGLDDFCLGKENCQFYKKLSFRNREITEELPFNFEELEKFLEERYRADGYVMKLIVKALRMVQVEKATGEIILIGHRGISSHIRDKFGQSLNPMHIFRKMQILIKEGVIEKAIQGKSGEFRNQANGYKFLPWKPPTHINTYV